MCHSVVWKYYIVYTIDDASMDFAERNHLCVFAIDIFAFKVPKNHFNFQNIVYLKNYGTLSKPNDYLSESNRKITSLLVFIFYFNAITEKPPIPIIAYVICKVTDVTFAFFTILEMNFST